MPRSIGKRLIPRQAALDLVKTMKAAAFPRRFAAQVISVTNRETTGVIRCAFPSTNEFDVQVRANVDVYDDDWIWVREDQSAQLTFVFDGFVKGGGTGNNAANAPIPWTQSPGVTSPPSSSLVVQAASGQTTEIGRAGDPVQFNGDVDLTLNELADVNAGAPSDGDSLVWDNGTSKWIDVNTWKLSGWAVVSDTGNGDYSTLAAAVAASETRIYVDEGTYTSDAVSPVATTIIVGSGVGATILRTTASSSALSLSNNCTVMNLTVQNERNVAGDIQAIIASATIELRNVDLYSNNANGAATGSFGLTNLGTATLIRVTAEGTGSAGDGYGLANTGTAYVLGGRYVGDDRGISVDSGGTLEFWTPAWVDYLYNVSGTISGPFYAANAGALVGDQHRVTNTSGAAVTNRKVGYIDAAGEFKTTTSAYLEAAWCATASGAANNQDLYVVQRGHIVITLNGNCSAGDYLYTSTTAGQAQPQSYVRAELFAVALTANAAGAGGTCQALLLCNTQPVSLTLAENVYRIHPTDKGSDSDWNGTIDSLPGGAAVRYDHVSGDERNLRPSTANQYAKLRLYNSTRGDYALVDDNDPTGGAGYDGEITLTASVPGTWAATDVITLRSQTNTSTLGSSYFFDLEIENTTYIPALTRVLEIEWKVQDSGAGNERHKLHPWEANDNSKRLSNQTQVAAQEVPVSGIKIALIQRRFCILWSGSGAGTADAELKPRVAHVAVP